MHGVWNSNKALLQWFVVVATLDAAAQTTMTGHQWTLQSRFCWLCVVEENMSFLCGFFLIVRCIPLTTLHFVMFFISLTKVHGSHQFVIHMKAGFWSHSGTWFCTNKHKMTKDGPWARIHCSWRKVHKLPHSPSVSVMCVTFLWSGKN